MLPRYDPKRSRLRTYLRLCVDSFVMNQDKAAQRQKRGGNAIHLTLDFNAAEDELHGVAIDAALIPSPVSLEQFFEKEWIRSLFSVAVEELRKLCEARSRLTTFQIFEEYDLDEVDDISYDKLAAKHGLAGNGRDQRPGLGASRISPHRAGPPPRNLWKLRRIPARSRSGFRQAGAVKMFHEISIRQNT